MTTHRPPTWYVLEPRDEPCSTVNPKLYLEFMRLTNGRMGDSDLLLTEAYCVQWMDLYLSRGMHDRTDADNHSGATVATVTTV